MYMDEMIVHREDGYYPSIHIHTCTVHACIDDVEEHIVLPPLYTDEYAELITRRTNENGNGMLYSRAHAVLFPSTVYIRTPHRYIQHTHLVLSHLLPPLPSHSPISAAPVPIKGLPVVREKTSRVVYG